MVKMNNYLLIPGGLLLGLGIGLALGHPGPGLFIGLGSAFVVAAIVQMFASKK
ncbi:hypothetical protein LGQ02_03785 [Bacillus shivajii]|uniref:hypothetical protein n=1 Tax=Bacillus shivajii TaxID=1983719 RepID=UPI001CF9EB28|nr:hypothetical protein [Bacillus shivajii]UCZ53915.1 hypothetical protein LGQ02_03785 [Bacillus shivajii]